MVVFCQPVFIKERMAAKFSLAETKCTFCTYITRFGLVPHVKMLVNVVKATGPFCCLCNV